MSDGDGLQLEYTVTASSLSSESIHIAEYNRSLWWIMHHSHDLDRVSLSLTSYYDDSGVEHASPITSIGGPVMVEPSFIAFAKAWPELLRRYGLREPLHMKDFGNCGLYPEMKIAFLAEAVKLINSHKFFSISINVPQTDYRAIMPVGACKSLMSPYGFAFFCAVILNQRMARAVQKADLVMSYVVDVGSASASHLAEAYRELVKLEKQQGHKSSGAFAEDDDERVPALQAADMFAWASRKKEIEGGLRNVYAPLEDLFLENPCPPEGPWRGFHGHLTMPIESVKILAAPVHNWLSMKGRLPQIGEMLR